MAGAGGSAEPAGELPAAVRHARGQAVRVELPAGAPVVGDGVGIAESGGLVVDTAVRDGHR